MTNLINQYFNANGFQTAENLKNHHARLCIIAGTQDARFCVPAKPSQLRLCAFAAPKH